MNGRNPRATNSLSTNVSSIGACPKATFTHTVHERPNRAPQSHHFGLAASPQIPEDAARPKTKSAWRCQFRPGGTSLWRKITLLPNSNESQKAVLAGKLVKNIYSSCDNVTHTALIYVRWAYLTHLYKNSQHSVWLGCGHGPLLGLYGLHANAMETCTSTKDCCGGSIVSIQRP